ncbi:hypothetical protein SCP_1303970 [Sparassis crispa]|uniref:J domain-containing protein n=1 Tax=Sparassis crispa TaxID=139825 RepID=A0A401H2I9_9APHY|nr:hypothetical protein SCP_1303970 [Sparassis crispa]GBE88580.1 hypothetical protein SCP_1303970 [Sparassis crispa]
MLYTKSHLKSSPRKFIQGNNFSSSYRRKSHYKTLSVPHNATKNQIKSSYYKLSKLWHPDLTKDPRAKEKFQAVSEAYNVLGDDRKRRAYDRTIVAAASIRNPSNSFNDAAYTMHPSYERRRGATHAWEYSRRPRSGQHYTPPPGHAQQAHGHAQHPYARHSDPFSSPNVQRATGKKTTRPVHEGPTEADRISGESTFWRVVQVVGIVMLVATIGGGVSANAN